MQMQPTYLHLLPEQEPPARPCPAPFRALLIIEAACASNWRDTVSRWLVERGCLYAMTWGKGSTEWDTSIDIANIEKFDFKEIPEDEFVMTTWHDSEPLTEAMWYAKNNAYHPTVELLSTLLVHVADVPEQAKILSVYTEA